MDGFTFTIIFDGKTVTINNFPVTENYWKTVLKGTDVTLESPDGKTATLTYKRPNVLFNGNPFNGRSVSVSVSFPGSPGSGHVPNFPSNTPGSGN